MVQAADRDLAQAHHRHSHHAQLRPRHLGGDGQEARPRQEVSTGDGHHNLVLSVAVGVEEVDVLDAVHEVAPHPAALPLPGGPVQVLHLVVVASSPVQ